MMQIIHKYKRITIIFTILFVILVAFPFATGASPADKHQKIRVAFRYDDYSNNSPTDLEIKLIGILQKYSISCTFAIIPYVASKDTDEILPPEVEPLNEEKTYILKSAIASGIIEPALHGYSHEMIRGLKTEFSGLSYSDQMEKIIKGKNLLEDVLKTKITTFVPPWESYDINTLQCLEALDFNSISADLSGISGKDSGLKFLPMTSHLDELKLAINSARRSSDPQPLIVVLFHPFDFIEGSTRAKFSLEDFSNLLSWVASQKDIDISSINQLARENNFGVNRFHKNHKYFLASRLLPPSLLGYCSFYSPYVYYSQNYDNMKIKIRATVAIFIFVIVFVSIILAYFIGTFFFSRFLALAPFSEYCAPVLLVISLIYVFHNLRISYWGVTALSGISGACIGMWGALLKIKGEKAKVKKPKYDS